MQFSKMMEHNQVLQAQIKEQESEIRQLHQEFTAYQADCDKKMTGLQAELERSTHMMAILVAELEVREGEEYKNSIKEEAQRILQRGREVYKYKKPPPKGKG